MSAPWPSCYSPFSPAARPIPLARVFVTDAERWEFVRVDRVPCSGTGEGAAAAGGAVAGGSSAGPRYSFTRVRVAAQAS